MPSPIDTRKIIFSETQQLVSAQAGLISAPVTMTVGGHGNKTLVLTSGTTQVGGWVRLPLSSARTKGVKYTIVSGVTGTPTSNGIAVVLTSTDSINSGTSGEGLKGSTMGIEGTAITFQDDGASNYVTIASNTPPVGSTLVWVTGITT